MHLFVTEKTKIINKAARKPLHGKHLKLSFPTGPEGLVVHGRPSPPVQDALAGYFSGRHLLNRRCRDSFADDEAVVLVYDNLTHEGNDLEKKIVNTFNYYIKIVLYCKFYEQ